MKIKYRKDKLDTRYCIRCGILESDIKRDGSDGCYVGDGKSFPRHSYTTTRREEEKTK